MKQKFVKSTLATATLLAAGFMGNAMAHTVTGTITASDAVDVYNFQCFTDTAPLLPETVSSSPAHHVRLNLNSGVVRAQLGHISTTVSGHSPSTPNQDWTGSVSDSTTGVSSLALTPPAGKTAGTYNDKGYNIVVSKATSTTATAYSVDFHCENSTNQHTGTGALWTDSQTPTADFSTVIDNP